MQKQGLNIVVSNWVANDDNKGRRGVMRPVEDIIDW